MNSANHQFHTPDELDHQHDHIAMVASPRLLAGRASPPPLGPLPTMNLPLDWSMEQVDAAPKAYLPEEAWYGAEFKKQQPKPLLKKRMKHSGFYTGAFTMQGPDLTSNPPPNL